ncbi:hypothetical protein JI435_408860 [Parastagonospora nodorum SN15]|uniref:Uncharacterized protein n=1 Tax=Phaeosphaeria nodorum (strain SN15 / ATCC MYA-4574 / FGSC 10173) TaxID=321614 RepID=A0A7U2HZQ8_PHANO|nr:hypothetical protein JI435_408860 [Parastagonospora nodorum SN15]
MRTGLEGRYQVHSAEWKLEAAREGLDKVWMVVQHVLRSDGQ